MSNKDFNKKFSPQTGKDNLKTAGQKPAGTAGTTQYTQGKADTRTQPNQDGSAFKSNTINPAKGTLPTDRQR